MVSTSTPPVPVELALMPSPAVAVIPASETTWFRPSTPVAVMPVAALISTWETTSTVPVPVVAALMSPRAPVTVPEASTMTLPPAETALMPYPVVPVIVPRPV